MERDFSRQSDLVPAEGLAQRIDVIGVGAVGRNVALMLASVGARNVRLFDHDIVDASNVTTQGFRASEIGYSKPECVANEMKLVDPACSVSPVARKWYPAIRLPGIVFSCVDSMEARRAIHESALDCSLVIDGRMLGEVGYVFPYINTPESRAAYAKTLFSDAEAEPGRCTQKSTLYCATHVASAMVYMLVRHLRGQNVFHTGGLVGEFDRC